MFKKAKRVNLRRRNESDEDEKDDIQPPQQLGPQVCGPQQVPFLEDVPVQELDSSIAGFQQGNGFQSQIIKAVKKEKEKKTRDIMPTQGPTKGSLLSFDDEEDGPEVFRVKKSNYSKKIVKQLKKEYKEDLEKIGTVKHESNSDTCILPLSAIKEEAITSSRAGSEQGEEAMEVDSSEEKQREEAAAAAAAAEEEEEQKGQVQAIRNSISAGSFNTLSQLSTLRPGEIPDAAFIHAARKRRQQAREQGGEPPLVDAEAPKKRQVREEDQDGSEDEDEDDKRINFSAVRTKSQRQKIAEEIGIEGSDDEALDTGHDEELSRWEQEQIRKGISIPQVQSSQPEDPSSMVYYQSGYESHPYGLSYPYGGLLPEAAPAPYAAPPAVLAPVSTDLVKKRLRDRLSQMRAGYDANAKRYHRIQEELTASNKAILRLEGSSNDNAEQYKFLQEMRGYVGDLLECFNEKVPTVLELEAGMHQLLRQRASRLVQRRQDDIKDESADFASLSNKAVMAPSLDSFGRDRSAFQELSRQRRSAEREARRTRRRQAREQNGKRAEHREGVSSDDEETSTDITSFNMERERIVKECRKVFEDVMEDFHSLDCLKARFEAWRRDFSTCYQEAYIGLCLPKLFNPLVRLQLVPWNPLEVDCADFEHMLWFESLLFYGCDEQNLRQKGDADANLLPCIVERVVLPKLAVLTEQVWDPLSTSQTVLLVSFIQRLVRGYPTVINGDNRNTQEFLKTVVLRARRALDEDVFLPLYPKHVLNNKNGRPYLFFQRQFWSCVKLLGNLLQWEGLLSGPALRELALDTALNRYILSALQTTSTGEDAIAKSQRVVDCFPAQWFHGLKGQQTLPQLEPFCRYLSHQASLLYRCSLGGSDLDRRNAKEQIKDVVKLLGQLHALDHIVAVATEHGIKDIKPLLEAK